MEMYEDGDVTCWECIKVLGKVGRDFGGMLKVEFWWCDIGC